MRQGERRSLFRVLPRPAAVVPDAAAAAAAVRVVTGHVRGDSPEFEAVWQDLLAFFADPTVDEVLVNGTHGLWLVQAAGLTGRPSPFASTAAFSGWLLALARREGVRLDPLCGAAGGSLMQESFRWHCVLPPLSQDGPLFSLRRHRFDVLSLCDFAAAPAVLAAVAAAMTARSCVLVAGPTGAGKTSLLVALLRAYAAAERVVIVEALAELPRVSAACVRLLERRANLENIGEVGMARLVSEALRLRPDRLVVGEIRGSEARVFVETLGTGHGGMMATIHAGSVEEALARLRCLAGPDGGVTRPALHVVLVERGCPPRIRSLTHVDGGW